MTPLSSRNRFPIRITSALFFRLSILLAVLFVPLIQSASAQSFISPLDRAAYVREFVDALPEGVSHSDASPQDFAAAVQKVILAHPASKAPAVAYAITSYVGIERAKEVAEAIAKLFDKHPELRELVTDIARAMTDALRSRIGPVAEGGSFKDGDFKDILPLGDHPAIMEQIDQAVNDVLAAFSDPISLPPWGPVFPPGVQPGEIISHETPVINA